MFSQHVFCCLLVFFFKIEGPLPLVKSFVLDVSKTLALSQYSIGCDGFTISSRSAVVRHQVYQPLNH